MQSTHRAKTHRHVRLLSKTSTSNLSTVSESEDRISEGEGTGPRSAPWRALFFFTTRSHVPMLAIAIFLSVISGATNPAQSFIIGKLFNAFTAYSEQLTDDEQLLRQETKYILYTVILASVTWVVRSLEFTAWLAFGELQARSARARLFEGLLKKEANWYDTRSDGMIALLARTQVQIRDLQVATAQPLGMSFTLSATSILSLVQALIYSWDLTLVTISTVPVIMGLIVWVGRPVQYNIEKQHEKLLEAQKLSSGALRAIDTVKCFNGQELELSKYKTCIEVSARWYIRIAHANALQMALFVLLSVSTFVQGFYYGSVLVSGGKKNTGQVITTFLSAIDAFQAIQGVLPHMLVLEKGRAAGAMLRAIMSHSKEALITRRRTPEVSPTTCHGDIDVRNISFAYPTRPDHPVLENVSLYIPGGEVTFLVGKSGSGKSTLGQLLLRMYPLCSGQISLDGHLLTSIESHWLRSNITLIEQQSSLFDDTIFENIALARQDTSWVSRSEAMQAAEFALLKTMLNDAPDGLNTKVGIKGSAMSGGQRQRIALARARLRDTPILILDESTSALDQTNRSLMMDAIRQWRRGKTTVIITHDMAQIGPDDYVFVLEQGRLVQEGYRKRMERLEDTPFQNFLKKDSSAVGVAHAQDSKCGSVEHPDSFFKSSEPRGKRHDFMDNPFTSQVYIPGKTRISRLHAVVQGSPLTSTRSFLKAHPNLRSASPWRRTTNPLFSLAPRPVVGIQRILEDDGNVTLYSEDDMSLISNRRWSIGLEDLMDRTGRSAVGLRSSGATRARRSVSHPVEMPLKPVRRRKRVIANHRRKQNTTTHQVQSINQVLRTIWPSLGWVSRIYLVTGFWAATVHAVASPVFAYTLSRLLDTYAIPGGDEQQALALAMAILAVAVTDAVHVYLLRFLLEHVSQSWVDSMRCRALQFILNQPMAFFEKEENNATILSERLDGNAGDMRNLLGRIAALIYVVVMLCVISVIWALTLQWKLTLVVLAVGPFIYGISTTFSQISTKWETSSNNAAEAAGAVFVETFTNIKTVRILTLEPYFRNKHTKASNHALKVGLKRSFFVGFFYGLADAAGTFSTALIFYVGTRLVLAGVPVSNVIGVFTLLLITIANTTAILSFMPQLASAHNAASRLLRLAQLPVSSHEHDGHAPLPGSVAGDITISDLSFAYPTHPDVRVLNHLSLRLRAGLCTAVVGASGSGKSTLAALLLRLHPVSSGAIHLGPHPLSSLSTPSLRNRIALVPQRPVLFPATVAANIAYPFPTPSSSPPIVISRDFIASAARLAGLHDFIASLPQGYDTVIGEGGLGLSGGQTQMLALARALVREPEVLVLDEATAGLDPESARGVWEGLRGWGGTRVAITHDLRVMEGADWVVVLEGGRVMEEGRYVELVGRRRGWLRGMVLGGRWDG